MNGTKSAAEIVDEMMTDDKTLEEITEALLEWVKQEKLTLAEVMSEMLQRFEQGSFPTEEKEEDQKDLYLYDCTINMKGFHKSLPD